MWTFFVDTFPVCHDNNCNTVLRPGKIITSYFAVRGMFLGLNLWAVVCSPQLITAHRVWGVGLYNNTVTNCQIVSTWGHRKHVRFEQGSFECCVYEQQLTNPARYTFKTTFLILVMIKVTYNRPLLMRFKSRVRWKITGPKSSVRFRWKKSEISQCETVDEMAK